MRFLPRSNLSAMLATDASAGTITLQLVAEGKLSLDDPVPERQTTAVNRVIDAALCS
jgi:hypothetical protein